MKKLTCCLLVLFAVLCTSFVCDANTVKENTDEKSSDIKALVVYFSVTGNTAKVSEDISQELNCDIHEIVPLELYTEEDIDYTNPESRTSLEQNDDSARPEINAQEEDTLNISEYDYIFLGYPIWHGEAPKIMYTFLETYDFSGKTIIPFCTSASSGAGKSAENMTELTEEADWIDCMRFSSDADKEEIKDWTDNLKENVLLEDKMNRCLKIKVGDNELNVKLEDNSSVDALIELIESNNGEMILLANNNGGFEKVCSLGESIKRNDKQITASAGDVCLYNGNKIVIFYGSNSWSYTKIGKITNADKSKLKKILSGKDTEVVLKK